ncbi:thiolase family protein [Halorubrum sp. SP3]|uniref:thiolase C-terminal domain-containing protein n=1 Tax=unclassified Halorubrum TaxID=2642239 RepID=UPI0010F58263|nr:MULTISPECIES: beta-ketoacyl synthase N-terminal-like domain-containing protein [unclassified Halorubrum]TKX54023.1 thiolase family protein [Halorubrum sp. SP3]TKX67675.1 thiolase family protein [Halorubrum sp. SP9]
MTTEVRVGGVGMTPFESDSGRSLTDLAATAAERALDDAAVDLNDVDALHFGNALAEALDESAGLANALAAALGLDGASADRIENTSATGASAFHRGVDRIERGEADAALVVGAEKMSAGDTRSVTEAISRLVHRREYAQGITLPSFGGLAAGAYLDRHDAPREALAAVAAKNHANAVDNPVAQFRKSIDVEDALDSPVVAAPLRLYDCCPMSDGAAAVVLTRAGDADADAATADTGHPPAPRVAGVASATGTHAVAERPDPLSIDSVRTAGERVFDRAGIRPDDVDVACIHDAFTVLELIELEELGFYDAGTAWEATLDGDTALDGDLPVNPGGGLKARGHPLGATGLSQIVELVWQLRGDLPAGRRVDGAETAFAINVAGFGNNSVCTVLRA